MEFLGMYLELDCSSGRKLHQSVFDIQIVLSIVYDVA